MDSDERYKRALSYVRSSGKDFDVSWLAEVIREEQEDVLDFVVEHLQAQIGVGTHASLPSDVLLLRLIKTFESEDFRRAINNAK